MSIRLNPHIKFTPEDVRLIEQRDGALSALEWLALVPPDRFDGDWQNVYDELEHRIYWNHSGKREETERMNQNG